MLRSNRLSSSVAAFTRLHPRQIEVPMQRVERCRGQLIPPLLKLRLCPTSIKADNIVAEVFRKRQPIFAFTDKNIANATPG